MQSLSQRAVEARNALVKDGKDELANIIIEIQKNEEELLIVRSVTIAVFDRTRLWGSSVIRDRTILDTTGTSNLLFQCGTSSVAIAIK